MAFSIESRVPFLDHPLVELVLSFPMELKFHQGWSKFVQRKAAERRLPDEIVWRRGKLGFATPQKAWHTATRGSMRELLQEVAIPDFLDRTRIERMVSTAPTGSTALSEYWQTIFLLRWMHVFEVGFR